MYAHERRLRDALTAYERDDLIFRAGRFEDMQVELTEPGRQPTRRDLSHELSVVSSICDQVSNAVQKEIVFRHEARELGQARHCSVSAHDLAYNSSRWQGSKPNEVEGCLGVPRTLRHSAGTSSKREDVSRRAEIGWHGILGRQPLNARGRLPSGKAASPGDVEVDGCREGGSVKVVFGYQNLQAQPIHARLRHRYADKTPTV